MRASLIAAASVAIALAAPLGALVAAPTPGSGPYVAVVPPWRDADAVIDRAGGAPLLPFRAPFGALVEGGPDLPRRLVAAGAWTVLDGATLAMICGVSQ
ncbi:hypothetical protein [Oceanicella actignis]|uniref:hypothetical protein n=1 Tax=Oceanicella actignis TaxID=1189325 RepID=UPI0011E80634|nr:hypothetical protein [Oceanicella actignis]TYO89947.1 hypothetical protein LY05_01142 [Oceanicella actignis]